MTDDATIRQPGEGPQPAQPVDFEPVGEARLLLRETRAGTLATLDRDTGHPFASLVSVATDIDGSPLMLVSTLSAHTRNILADGRVSLLLSRPGRGDPLAHPRLTVVGRAAMTDAPRAKARFLARHPKSALYADFGDFAMLRIAISGGHLNGGFARAARLSADELLTDLGAAADLVAAESGAVAHMNADHRDALALYATRLLGRRDGAWRATGIDPDGLDLALGDETARLQFPEPVHDGAGLRAVLVDLAQRSRSTAPGRGAGS